jgi:hypothetical protein
VDELTGQEHSKSLILLVFSSCHDIIFLGWESRVFHQYEAVRFRQKKRSPRGRTTAAGSIQRAGGGEGGLVEVPLEEAEDRVFSLDFDVGTYSKTLSALEKP